MIRNNYLREARRRRGLSQQQLAQKLGVTSFSVSRWERGESFPTPAHLVQLCQLLLISPHLLECKEEKAIVHVVMVPLKIAPKTTFQTSQRYWQLLVQ